LASDERLTPRRDRLAFKNYPRLNFEAFISVLTALANGGQGRYGNSESIWFDRLISGAEHPRTCVARSEAVVVRFVITNVVTITIDRGY